MWIALSACKAKFWFWLQDNGKDVSAFGDYLRDPHRNLKTGVGDEENADVVHVQ